MRTRQINSPLIASSFTLLGTTIFAQTSPAQTPSANCAGPADTQMGSNMLDCGGYLTGSLHADEVPADVEPCADAMADHAMRRAMLGGANGVRVPMMNVCHCGFNASDLALTRRFRELLRFVMHKPERNRR